MAIFQLVLQSLGGLFWFARRLSSPTVASSSLNFGRFNDTVIAQINVQLLDLYNTNNCWAGKLSRDYLICNVFQKWQL